MLKCTRSERACLCTSGYALKCIAPLFPIGTRNLHCSPSFYTVRLHGVSFLCRSFHCMSFGYFLLSIAELGIAWFL